MKVLAYIFMLLFDFSILAGTVYLIDKGWSPWWLVLTVFIMLGSNPNPLFKDKK